MTNTMTYPEEVEFNDIKTALKEHGIYLSPITGTTFESVRYVGLTYSKKRTRQCNAMRPEFDIINFFVCDKQRDAMRQLWVYSAEWLAQLEDRVIEMFIKYRKREIEYLPYMDFDKQTPYQTKNFNYMSHYTYLDFVIDKFWHKVFNKTREEMWCAGNISAHGDKCYQYKNNWDMSGVPFNRGALLFLMTYHSSVMDRPKHESDIWVIDNYPKYLPLIEEVEREVLKEEYGIEI